LTFKDLKKRVSLQVSQEETRLFERLKGKPFWIWDKQQHKQEDVKTGGDCCFNHIIGLPQKDSIDKPLYDYERIKSAMEDDKESNEPDYDEDRDRLEEDQQEEEVGERATSTTTNQIF